MTILEWQNLIFVLPMLAAILYLLLMTVGFSWSGSGDMDVGHDIHVDLSADPGHDVHVDAGHGSAGEAGHGAGSEHGGHGLQVSLLGRIFGLLGIGKVPLSILVLSVCFTWGATGLVLNILLGADEILRVILIAGLVAAIGARGVAEGIAFLLPREESYHTPKEELVGQVGEVLYEVTRTSGTVRLCDPSGNLQDLDCRIQDGDGIKAGTKVVLQEYEAGKDVFFVRG